MKYYGEADKRVPTQVFGLESGMKAVSAGEQHTCAITTAGIAMCWGLNATGQLGDGTLTDRLTPQIVINAPDN